MVDRVSQIPFSPLRTSSIGFIDDYESGMEASASSMAEEEEEGEEEEEEKEEAPKKSLPGGILDYKKCKASHRRMSSGNSSTDSNTTIPHVSTKRHHVIPRAEFTSPLYKNIQSPSVSARLSRKEELPTPSSGYDGDTEGPLVEDNI
ncbi:hypothetical protein HPULCUR_002946 [Helicostylum pulchrum]|uniref:Uncharacterized protein n=1 Tax=Helicostylum pulchrum TaxID=562976 RepID=A0ABP9XTK4_9FUNG